MFVWSAGFINRLIKFKGLTSGSSTPSHRLRVCVQFKNQSGWRSSCWYPMTRIALTALCTIFQALGLLITILRLGYRVRMRMFWVEDMWAVAALMCGAAAMTSAWTYTLTDGRSSIISFWVCSFTFPSAVWAVRQSILFSLARIFWSTRSLRCITYTIASIFLVLYGALVSQKSWQYGHNLNWYNHPDENGKVRAYLTRPMIIFELITDLISDTILVSLSLRLLWGVKLPTNERMMILTTFSMSVFVTLASIFRTTCQLMHLGSILRIAADLQLSVSLITCNLLVATTYIYRLMARRRQNNVSGSESTSDIEFSQVTVLPSQPPVTLRLDGTRQLLTTLDLTYCIDSAVTQAETY